LGKHYPNGKLHSDEIKRKLLVESQPEEPEKNLETYTRCKSRMENPAFSGMTTDWMILLDSNYSLLPKVDNFP
jgi:hypothetical protein